MKMENYRDIENSLYKASSLLFKALKSVSAKDDEKWKEKLLQTIVEVKCLQEEMIFTFKIED